MAAITPVTALPANAVSPSGMITTSSALLRLQAIASAGAAQLYVIQKSEGGDWFKVLDANGHPVVLRLNADVAEKACGSIVINNPVASTAYHVMQEGGGTVTAYLAGCTATTSVATLAATTLTVSGDSTLTGNETVGGTLGVTGATTLAAAATVGTTLGVTGAATLSSTLAVTGAATLSSTLAVTGASTLTGAVTFGGKQLATATANVIADPGTGQAIPVTTSGVCMITTAASETNTLAVPAFVGQVLDLICDTYAVGNRVVTASQRINQAANTVMTFGAVGDYIRLIGVKIGGALRWQVVANDGVALS